MKVALGVTTFNRPEYAEKCLRAINHHLTGVVEYFIVHNDGSDSKYAGAYKRAYKKLPQAVIQESLCNQGVAKAKNALLREMITTGADWLFLCEDDILVQSPESITGYIDACESSGLSHLSFAHHGPANVGGMVGMDEAVAYYPHSIGAWCCYTSESLQSVGLFDTHFFNAWEHVELTLRLARAGYTTGAYNYADAIGSRDWLKEAPMSLDHSLIRNDPRWYQHISEGLRYWRDSKPETFNDLFGEGTHLHDYAQGILNG